MVWTVYVVVFLDGFFCNFGSCFICEFDVFLNCFGITFGLGYSSVGVCESETDTEPRVEWGIMQFFCEIEKSFLSEVTYLMEVHMVSGGEVH